MRSIQPTGERAAERMDADARATQATACKPDALAHAAAVVLRLESLHVTFSTPDGEVAAVRDVSLEVRRGECVGVVGESGAGKSQAFLAPMGLLAANGTARGRADFCASGGAASGSAAGGTSLAGTTSAGTALAGTPFTGPPTAPVDLLQLKRSELDRLRGARIGMVFQDSMTSLTPHLCVGDQIAEPMVIHLRISWREARSRALELLRRVRMTDPERRARQFPHELSGGMRQRVMIAIALACEPDLLIADEPTTALDVTIQAQILALLADLKRERGMAMVLISHDLGAVAGVADRVAVMQAGRIVELDSARAVLKAPRHPYTQALLRALPLVVPANAPPAAAAPSNTVLTLSRLSVQFAMRQGLFGSRAALRAVDDVSLELRAGEALGIVGESGSGKTTLARAALRLIRPTRGRIVWLGTGVENSSARDLKDFRRDVQVVFQDPLASLDPRMTVGEIVAEPLRVHCPELGGQARAQAVAEMLLRVGISPDLVNRYPHEFSGGQCQRIGIARAMILKPRLLVCDEPVSALDVSIQAQVVRLLGDLKREYGLSILFVSHNLAVVRQLCERVLVLYLGRMMELAPADRLYERPLHPYTRELLETVPVPDPDIQPSRLSREMLATARASEPPSPLAPPSGCVYRTRCPHALEACAQTAPGWDEVGHSERIACHRWRELLSLNAESAVPLVP